MSFIRWFDNTRLTDRDVVGGKCAGLGELIAAGADVPPGFAVTTEAFDALADGCGLSSELDALTRVGGRGVTVLGEAYRRAVTMILSAPMPAGLLEQLRAAHAELCWREGIADVPVAVRSSAVVEDGDTASFAGQQESFLWTVGFDDIEARLRQCWASLFTPHAIAYRSRLSGAQMRHANRISVGIQTMVDAEVAGVAVTVSPRTGDRSRVGINASWGLGQSVVGGEVTPDEYWLSKVDLSELSRVVAHKTRETLPDPARRGVVTLDVPIERRGVACLSREQARLVADMAMRVEQHMGTPQDIEWAISRPTATRGGRLLVLQSRPETTWQARREEGRAKVTPTTGYLAMIHAAGAQVGELR